MKDSLAAQAIELLSQLNATDQEVWITYGKILFIYEDDSTFNLFAEYLSDSETSKQAIDKIEKAYTAKLLLKAGRREYVCH